MDPLIAAAAEALVKMARWPAGSPGGKGGEFKGGGGSSGGGPVRRLGREVREHQKDAEFAAKDKIRSSRSSVISYDRAKTLSQAAQRISETEGHGSQRAGHARALARAAESRSDRKMEWARLARMDEKTQLGLVRAKQKERASMLLGRIESKKDQLKDRSRELAARGKFDSKVERSLRILTSRGKKLDAFRSSL